MFDSIIEQKLATQQTFGLLRQRMVVDDISAAQISVAGKEYLNFASNDYLGIASNSSINNSSLLPKVQFGAMASPLVVGRHQIHQELEQTILDWVGAPNTYDCLLFGSGYSANTGVISALFNTPSSTAFLYQDKLNHASLMDVGRNSQALGHCRQSRFAHNDLHKLQNLLVKHSSKNLNTETDPEKKEQKLVVSEGVFSMDGDQPNLTSLAQISKQHNAWLMLDDAHGIGIHGKQGAGSLSAQQLSLTQCDILVVTFGKAIGAQGAAVIASKQTIEYLINFSRDYIYSTHLSPLQTAAALQNIKLIQQDDWRREKLFENIEYFRAKMKSSAFELADSHSPIQPILIGDENKAVALAQKLKESGLWTSAMRYPTVAKKQARIRVTITASHSEQDIDQLIKQVS